MNVGPVRWIVTNWRLKVLSLVLAIGLLAGVTFSENPPVLGSVTVKVNYQPLPTDLVVVNPPTTIEVPVAGFRSDVQRYEQTTAGVTIDLSRAHPGRNQVYVARPRTDIQGISFRQSAILITLDIEPLVTRQLDIEVRATNKSAGVALVPDHTYATCGNANDRCQVSVAGPASVLATLKAYVNYDVPITTATTADSPNQQIKFEQNGRDVDLGKTPQTVTVPQILWTPEKVSVLVTTQGGNQTKLVPVAVRVQGSQPCGYQISNVDVQPGQVTINGPADAVSRIMYVSLDPIPLTGLTTGQRFPRVVVTGTGVSSDPQQVTVTVTGYQAFNCSAPSPQPTPTPAPGAAPGPPATPTPTPTPVHTPTPSAT